MQVIFAIIFIMLFLTSYAQSNLNKEQKLTFAKEYLKEAISNLKNESNLVDGKRLLIKNKKALITFIEPILFDIYGKNLILAERPYECFKIDKYWVAFGYLPQGKLGGTFEVVVDGSNAQIIRIIHEK